MSLGPYIFSLSAEDNQNWEICKAHGLIGIRHSPQAHRAIQDVSSGDVIYLWLSGGARQRGGLKARMEADGIALPAKNVPWPRPEIYSYTLKVRNIVELAEAVPDTFPGNRVGLRFKVQNTDVQKGFRPLSPESETAMKGLFTDSAGE